MFKAKFDKKEEVANGTKFWVLFTNGKEVKTEWCIPQTKRDFKVWIESRTEALNTAEELEGELQVGSDINLVEEVKEVESVDANQLQKQEWFDKVNKLHRIKTYLIDTKVIPPTHKRVLDLIAEIQSTQKPEYIDLT